MTSIEILKKYWGYDSFRLGQESIVDDVVNGHDVLALLPTGGGKSICFQVPGLMREGITIVISPLIALMQDQVANLESRGIMAKALTSGMSYRELDITLDNARFGSYKFLYTSPERIQSKLFVERFKQMNVGLIVVDESHCISEWGHDFRPSFMEIKKLRTYHPNVPIIALTATATEKTKNEIIEKLELRNPRIHQSKFERKNLIYQSYISNNKLSDVINCCRQHQDDTGIVYCQTRKSVKFVANALYANGISVGIYHGGMTKPERENMLTDWLKGRLKVMVATNAFGMGIDKPDVRYVAHYEFPNSLEAYFQEAGRGGRDGNDAVAINFWQESDLEQLQKQLEQKFPLLDDIKRVYRALCNHLKVAIGSGEGETYPFELNTFAKSFQLSPVLCYNALLILESMGEVVFSENVFQATKIKFTVGNTVLYNFQIQNEKYYPLTSLLTRFYPGIFQNFIDLDEEEFCKRLNIGVKELTEQLLYLEKYGIIDLSLRSESPRVTFLRPRMPYDYLEIRPEVYLFRKQVAEEKLEYVKQYLQTTTCRAQLIIRYFGLNSDPCGRCDNCVKNSNAYKDLDLESEMLHIISEGPVSNYDIISKFPHDESVKNVLRKLVNEEKIHFDGENYQIAKK